LSCTRWSNIVIPALFLFIFSCLVFTLLSQYSTSHFHRGHGCLVFEKLFFKFFCVYLLLEKLVNEKYFSINEKYFLVEKKFDLVSRKVFFLLAVFVFRKVVSGKPLSKLSCVCLSLKKLVNGKHFPVKEKFGLVFRKVFSWKI